MTGEMVKLSCQECGRAALFTERGYVNMYPRLCLKCWIKPMPEEKPVPKRTIVRKNSSTPAPWPTYADEAYTSPSGVFYY